MKTYRLPSALAAALLVHAVAFVGMARVRPRSLPTSSAVEALDELVVVEDALRPSIATEPSSPASDVSAPRASGMVHAARTSPTAATHEVAPAPPEPAPEPAPTGSQAPWSLQPNMDLGIGTYWMRVATGAPTAPSGAPEPSTAERELRASLRANGGLGLGPSGRIVAAARDAASPSIAPDVGSATIDVDTDATGKVTTRVVSVSSDYNMWLAVAEELARLLSAQTLAQSRDSRIRRTRIEIRAARPPASGDLGDRGVGAISDEACQGSGWTRRCTAGLPAGARGSFDVSNSGPRSRIVRVRVLDDGTL